jgi:hypothetical protein
VGNTFRTLSIETSIGQIQIHGVRSANDLGEQYGNAADPGGKGVGDRMRDEVWSSARKLGTGEAEGEDSELQLAKGPTRNLAGIIARLLVNDERRGRE